MTRESFIAEHAARFTGMVIRGYRFAGVADTEAIGFAVRQDLPAVEAWIGGLWDGRQRAWAEETTQLELRDALKGSVRKELRREPELRREIKDEVLAELRVAVKGKETKEEFVAAIQEFCDPRLNGAAPVKATNPTQGVRT